MQNRTDLLQQLTQINRQLEHAEIAIDNQKRLIVSLNVAGEDTAEAVQLLASLHKAHDARLEEFDRLLDALDSIPLDTESTQS
jgi:hypothetical protein